MKTKHICNDVDDVAHITVIEAFNAVMTVTVLIGRNIIVVNDVNAMVVADTAIVMVDNINVMKGVELPRVAMVVVGPPLNMLMSIDKLARTVITWQLMLVELYSP
jgi:galactitol-specific phosphotransferase system IIC component